MFSFFLCLCLFSMIKIQCLLIRENKSSKMLSPGVVYTSVISAFGRWQQDGQKFKACLGYIKSCICVYINSVIVEHAIIPALEGEGWGYGVKIILDYKDGVSFSQAISCLRSYLWKEKKEEERKEGGKEVRKEGRGRERQREEKFYNKSSPCVPKLQVILADFQQASSSNHGCI